MVVMIIPPVIYHYDYDNTCAHQAIIRHCQTVNTLPPRLLQILPLLTSSF